MPYPLSDEDSTDSESGIRFKTTNTRTRFSDTIYDKKSSKVQRSSHSQLNYKYDSKRSHRSRSRDRNETRSHRERSSDYKDQHRRRSYRSRTPEKSHTSSDLRKSEESRTRDKRKKDKRCDKKYKHNVEKIDALNTSKNKNNSLSNNTEDFTKKNESDSTLSSNKNNINQIESKNDESDIRSSREKKYREKTNTEKHILETKLISTSTEHFGPKLPPKLNANLINSSLDQYGPSLPKRMNSSTSESNEIINDNICASLTPQNNDVSDTEFYGPIIPSHLKNNIVLTRSPDVSPVLMEKQEVNNSDISDTVPTSPKIKQSDTVKIENRSQVIGPVIPLHLRTIIAENAEKISNESIINDTDSEEDVIGPLPAGQSIKNPNYIKLEERALQMKIDGLDTKDKDNEREEWMLELPQIQSASLGLGPRQFRTKGVPDMSDRSSWTDTPIDKAKKESTEKIVKIDLKKEAELKHIQERDVEQEKIVEKLKKKKKRDKSLIDIHQEELNKKKKEENSNKNERRPFSRDVDLKVNRFDEAQKKAILKKAQLLDTRFSSGESKFL